jgi:hypothetical protein
MERKDNKVVAGHILRYFFSENAEGYEVYNELGNRLEAVIPYNAIPLLEHCSEQDICDAVEKYAV